MAHKIIVESPYIEFSAIKVFKFPGHDKFIISGDLTRDNGILNTYIAFAIIEPGPDPLKTIGLWNSKILSSTIKYGNSIGNVSF